MSRLIDADKLNRKDVNCANTPMNFIDTAPTVEAIPKADYENRLKADMVAMLDKIRDEIERKAHSGQWSDATMYGMLKAVAIIDKYKAEIEG